MLTVWGRQSSSNVQAVLWCVFELGLPYRRIDAGLKYGVNDTPDYLRMNPNGTVPTIQDGDNAPIWESGAILRYLSSTYASDAFWPKDNARRTLVDMWAEWSKINVALKFTGPVFWPAVRLHESRRDESAIAAAVIALEQTLSIADQRLSRSRFLVSDELTLADIQFAHVLHRYFDIDIERSELLHVHRYYDMLTKRPAFQEAVMVSYEELRNTL